MMRFHVRVTIPSLVLALAAAAPHTAQAQLPFRLAVEPYVGLVDPRGSTSGARLLEGGALDYDALEGAWQRGLAIEVGLRQLPVGIRVSSSRSEEADQTGHIGCYPTDATSICAAVLVEVPSKLTVTTRSIEITGRIGLGSVDVHPSLGVARTHYEYRWLQKGPIGAISLAPGQAEAEGTGARAGLGISFQVIEYLRVRGDWHEALPWGDVDTLRPTRLSSFNVGAELVLGG